MTVAAEIYVALLCFLSMLHNWLSLFFYIFSLSFLCYDRNCETLRSSRLESIHLNYFLALAFISLGNKEGLVEKKLLSLTRSTIECNEIESYL